MKIIYVRIILLIFCVALLLNESSWAEPKANQIETARAIGKEVGAILFEYDEEIGKQSVYRGALDQKRFHSQKKAELRAHVKKFKKLHDIRGQAEAVYRNPKLSKSQVLYYWASIPLAVGSIFFPALVGIGALKFTSDPSYRNAIQSVAAILQILYWYNFKFIRDRYIFAAFYSVADRLHERQIARQIELVEEIKKDHGAIRAAFVDGIEEGLTRHLPSVLKEQLLLEGWAEQEVKVCQAELLPDPQLRLNSSGGTPLQEDQFAESDLEESIHEESRTPSGRRTLVW